MAKLPKVITDAIAAGEELNSVRSKREQELKAKEWARKQEAEADRAKSAARWVREKLPKIIRDETAKGYRRYSLDIDGILAKACENAGLTVNREWHESARDPDGGPGNYEGWMYEVVW